MFSLLFQAALLLLSPISARAWGFNNCSDDSSNSYNCGSNAAVRYGVGIGIAVLFVLLFLFWARHRRQRVHASNLAFAQQQQNAMGGRPIYGNAASSYGQQPYQGSTGGYPSQSYGANQTGMYNANTDNYTGVQAPPPVYSGDPNGFSPPAGPPPNFSPQHDSTLTSEQREQQQHEENLRLAANGAPPHYPPPLGVPSAAGGK